MEWTVTFSAKARKQTAKLPGRIAERLDALQISLEAFGPILPDVIHFGRLKNWKGEVYHCHLNKGRPTYVAVWAVQDRTVQLVEVIYVGTHEKAPY
jgi:mRNA-degrading endonuclease RelE of RelBE toxin-antitoxin system